MRYLILMWITFLTGCSTTGQYSAGVPVYDIYELVDLDSGTEYQQVVSAYGSPTKRDSFSGEYTVAQYCNPIKQKIFNFQAAEVAMLVFKNGKKVGSSSYYMNENEVGNFQHCRHVIRNIRQTGVGGFIAVASVRKVKRAPVYSGGSTGSVNSSNALPPVVIQPPVLSDQGPMFETSKDRLNSSWEALNR